MKKTISQAVKEYKERHGEDIKQLSIFELFGIEDIIIKVRKK